jgi:hypothetical protein
VLGRITGILNTAAQGIQQGGSALVQSILSIAGQLAPSFAPWAGLLGGVVNFVSSLFGGGKKTQPVEVVNEPVVHFAQSTTYGFAANPASAALGGRLLLAGAGATPAQVEIELKGDASELFAAKVADRILTLSDAQGGLA